MITTKRLRNGHYAVLRNGERIGEAWRVRRPGKHFGMSIDGVYWRKGEPNTVSGVTATGANRLRDLVELATKHFDAPPPQA